MARYKAIISYTEMLQQEGVSLQRGMNFRIKPNYSIILMSVRRGAPYNDRWHDDTGLLEYEGHDEPKKGDIDPKTINQPLRNSNGNLTENGKFYEAAMAYKNKNVSPEEIQVYEKISRGIWCDQGRFELIDAIIAHDGKRNVFRFFMQPTQSSHRNELFLKQTRIIPTQVKVEVWKRDHGSCVICGSKENLHFDHDIPYSKGGSSITEKNVRLLCAKHNLSKSDKIMGYVPWIAGVASFLLARGA
ncbi:MAG: HNH endonuclease [Sedimentisphaerales bacterium]|nr:HNH endonuclease [Sedimentisphaerales bacterium]